MAKGEIHDLNIDSDEIICRVFDDVVDSVVESEVFDSPCIPGLEESEFGYRAAIHQLTGKYYRMNGKRYTLHRIMGYSPENHEEDIYLQVCINNQLRYIRFFDMWESCGIENEVVNNKLANFYNGAKTLLPTQQDHLR